MRDWPGVSVRRIWRSFQQTLLKPSRFTTSGLVRITSILWENFTAPQRSAYGVYRLSCPYCHKRNWKQFQSQDQFAFAAHFPDAGHTLDTEKLKPLHNESNYRRRRRALEDYKVYLQRDQFSNLILNKYANDHGFILTFLIPTWAWVKRAWAFSCSPHSHSYNSTSGQSNPALSSPTQCSPPASPNNAWSLVSNRTWSRWRRHHGHSIYLWRWTIKRGNVMAWKRGLTYLNFMNFYEFWMRFCPRSVSHRLVIILCL
mgnify:CR=1 FL=1